MLSNLQALHIVYKIANFKYDFLPFNLKQVFIFMFSVEKSYSIKTEKQIHAICVFLILCITMYTNILKIEMKFSFLNMQ